MITFFYSKKQNRYLATFSYSQAEVKIRKTKRTILFMFIKNGQVFGRERYDRTQRNPSVTPLEHKKDKISYPQITSDTLKFSPALLQGVKKT